LTELFGRAVDVLGQVANLVAIGNFDPLANSPAAIRPRRQPISRNGSTTKVEIVCAR